MIRNKQAAYQAARYHAENIKKVLIFQFFFNFSSYNKKMIKEKGRWLRMKLLLVEDELRMAQALCEILRQENYQVDDVFQAQGQNPRELEVCVLKQRYGAVGIRIPYRFYPAYSCFEELPSARSGKQPKASKRQEQDDGILEV